MERSKLCSEAGNRVQGASPFAIAANEAEQAEVGNSWNHALHRSKTNTSLQELLPVQPAALTSLVVPISIEYFAG